MDDDQLKNFVAGLVGYSILLVFACIPAMLMLSIIKAVLSLSLDRGQMWTFSILITCGLAITLATFLRIFSRTGKGHTEGGSLDFFDACTYSLTLLIAGSAIIVFILLAACFGFHALFPAQFLSYFH
jgi:hypothetical protein